MAFLPRPVWYRDITSKVSPYPVLTSALRSWESSVQLAPRTITAVKNRNAEQSNSKRFAAALSSMSETQGRVADSYPRLLQVLVDVAVAFYYLNAADGISVDQSSVHGEVFRLMEDSFEMCPSRLMVSFREANSNFDSSTSTAGTYSEYMIAHVLDHVVRELLPSYEASPEISFNNEARLLSGDTLMAFIERVRRCMTQHSVRERVARMFILTQIQSAGSSPSADMSVHNEVIKHIMPVVQGNSDFSSFYNEIRSYAALGGYLNRPILSAAPPPPPMNFYAPANLPPPPPTPLAAPAAPGALVAAPLPSDATALIAGGGPGAVTRRPWMDLTRIYPLLDLSPIPEYRDSRSCLVCEKLFGLTLIDWQPGAERPDPKSKTRWAHDPWRCPKVTLVCKNRRQTGDARFTEYLINGLTDRPITPEMIPVPPEA